MQSPTKVILYVIYAIIVVGLLTVIVTAFHSNKVLAPTQHSNPTQPATNQGAKTPTQSSPKSGSSTNQSQPQTSPNQAPASGGQATAQAPGTNGQLNNTGPGDTIGLFVAVTAAGAIGYRVVIGRKLKADKHL